MPEIMEVEKHLHGNDGIMAAKQALASGDKVLYANMEMPGQQIMSKFAKHVSGLNIACGNSCLKSSIEAMRPDVVIVDGAHLFEQAMDEIKNLCDQHGIRLVTVRQLGRKS